MKRVGATRQKKVVMANLAKILVIPVRGREGAADETIDVVRRERRARWVVVAVLGAALGMFWGGAVLSLREEATGIRELPAEARRSLYARTLDEVETICRDEAAALGSLRDHCVAQARFVEQLPECTDACRRAAAIILPHARR
jgi:hypothetical protein